MEKNIESRDLWFNKKWRDMTTAEKWKFSGLISFAAICPLSLRYLRFNSMEYKQAIAQEEMKEARQLLRNFKVEYRVRHGFLSGSSRYRELIQRDRPLTDIELDDIFKTLNPKDVLKDEIY